MRTGGALALLAATLLLVPTLLSQNTALAAPGDLTIENISLETSDGSYVSAVLGYIDGAAPTRLVTMAHGYGHNVEASWTPHVIATVRPDTAVIATNYRDNLGFPILKGAEDLNAATNYAMLRFPSITTQYMFAVSMGGATSGTALAENVAATGSTLYDYWIDLEPVTNPTETWAEATAIGHAAAPQIEDDAGGNPAEVPAAYARRTPLLHTADYAAGGLQGVAIVHDLNDGLVPYNQGREFAKAMAASGVPASFTTVLRCEQGAELGTTGTGAILGAMGQPDEPNESALGFCGHGSEADASHPVMRTGFAILNAMLDGTWTTLPYEEHVVDDQL